MDAALCYVARMQSRKDIPVSRFSWSDSSPLGGFDWLWSKHIEIHKSKLVETFDAAVHLTLSIEEADHEHLLLSEEDSEDDLGTFSSP